MDSDEQTFLMMAGHLRTVAEAMLIEFFGEQCPDFEPDCECCRRWKLLDDLAQNPFSDEQDNRP